MLTKCPECELPVSNKAATCPHCGYPIKSPTRKISTKKHMRLPNGFGQITELKRSDLRNRFRVRITVAKTDTGKPIAKNLQPKAYFATYQEAYDALAEYNKNPYDLDKVITVGMLYEEWSEHYFKELKSDSSKRTITSAWAKCSSVRNINVRSLRAIHIKNVMTQVSLSANQQSRIKSLFNIMLDYAVEYEYVDKNVARTFSVPSDIIEEADSDKNDHVPFTPEEISLLWDHSNNYWVSVILLQCYTGWRPSELCALRYDDVNINEMIMFGGMKTEAGENRVVPIHEKVQKIAKKIKELYEPRDYFLCDDNGSPMTYYKYRGRYSDVIAALNLDPSHRPHDPRKTFVTLAKKYNVDEYAIKRIVGHRINDLTESVYTVRDIDWLRSEIAKIE